MSGAPIVLHFYNDDNEIVETYSRGIVPWGILESALELQGIDKNNLTKEDLGKINSLVIEFFGNKFDADALKNQTEFSETFAVVEEILSRMESIKANPTRPGPAPKATLAKPRSRKRAR